MRYLTPAILLLVAPVALAQPFEGTVFMSPDVLTATDPSGLRSITYAGRAERPIFDRRTGEWATVEVYLFDVRLGSREVEFRVNREFADVAAARVEVDTFAAALGRLPAVLLSSLNYVVVNAGDELFGAAVGGSWHGGIIIHTVYGHGLGGFLEEALFHEAAHVALDLEHAAAPGWRAAQQADGGFISDYARDHPDREDVAESILPYFALRFRPESLSPEQRRAIDDAIPARLEYFDAQGFDWSPYMPAVPALPPAAVALLAAILFTISRGRR